MSKIQSDTEHLILNADGSGKEIQFQNDGTQNVVIDSSGNVGIGTASPTHTLEVNGGANNQVVKLVSTDAYAAIGLQDSTSSTDGSGNSYNSIAALGNNLTFWANNAERMRIDSGGNLLVGKTSGDITSAGVELRSDGLTQITRSGNKPLLLNRKTSDGDIAVFQKDGTTVGSIGSISGDVYLDTSTEGRLHIGGVGKYSWSNSYFTAQNDNARDLGLSAARWKDLYLSGRVLNVGGNNHTVELLGTDAGGNHRGLVVGAGAVGVNSDNSIDLGSSSNRFKNLYLSGGVYVGGTGSANKLDDYEEGTWTPTISGTSTAGSASYNDRVASYTKIGNLVNVSFYISGTFTSTPSGGVQITGLPFTSISSANGLGYPSTKGAIGHAASGYNGSLYIYAEQSQDKLYFGVTRDNTTLSGVNFSTHLSNSAFQMHIELTYRTS